MALKEGRCTNCGSILFLDPQGEKGHCLFCNAVFLNRDAFQAMSNPDSFAFPNEEQPIYEGPSLQPRPVGPTVAPTAAVAAPVRAARSEEEKFVPSVSQVPDMKIPRKTKIWASVGGVGIVLIFLAILLPLLLTRNTQRGKITEAFQTVLADDVDMATNFSILKLDNSQFVLSLDDRVDQAEAVELYRQYAEIRAEVMNKSQETKYEGLSMRLVTPQGGFLLDEEPLDEAIRALP